MCPQRPLSRHWNWCNQTCHVPSAMFIHNLCHLMFYILAASRFAYYGLTASSDYTQSSALMKSMNNWPAPLEIPVLWNAVSYVTLRRPGTDIDKTSGAFQTRFPAIGKVSRNSIYFSYKRWIFRKIPMIFFHWKTWEPRVRKLDADLKVPDLIAKVVWFPICSVLVDTNVCSEVQLWTMGSVLAFESCCVLCSSQATVRILIGLDDSVTIYSSMFMNVLWYYILVHKH